MRQVRKDHALQMLRSLEESRKEGEPAVHVTNAGWEAYTNHPDEEVRKVAKESKFCPKKYRTKVS